MARANRVVAVTETKLAAMELAELRIAATQSAKVGNGRASQRVSGDGDSSTERDRSSEPVPASTSSAVFAHRSAGSTVAGTG